jgi:hypothetical protein
LRCITVLLRKVSNRMLLSEKSASDPRKNMRVLSSCAFFDVPFCLNVKHIISYWHWRSAAVLSLQAQNARRQKV